MGSKSKPSPSDLAAAHGKRTVPDVLAPGLAVIFVGINPGLYSGATGHHFARPGNRFWPALHRSGFTPRQFHPSEAPELLNHGIGMTKLVHRATATAAELTPAELRRGGLRIRRLVRELQPRAVCFLGVGAYCGAYGLKRATVGRQAEPMEGAELWVLPNPSGLNANYQMPDFVRLFTEVRESVEQPSPPASNKTSRTPTPPAQPSPPIAAPARARRRSAASRYAP
jgi:TDG/mug DNA glycosylase family protein